MENPTSVCCHYKSNGYYFSVLCTLPFRHTQSDCWDLSIHEESVALHSHVVFSYSTDNNVLSCPVTSLFSTIDGYELRHQNTYLKSVRMSPSLLNMYLGVELTSMRWHLNIVNKTSFPGQLMWGVYPVSHEGLPVESWHSLSITTVSKRLCSQSVNVVHCFGVLLYTALPLMPASCPSTSTCPS